MGALKHTRIWSSQKGAELVEFALAFPLLLLVCLGIIDMGLLLQQHEVLTNAAREGARVSVLPDYGAADVEARVQQYLLGTGLTPATVTTTVGAPAPMAVAPGMCVTVVPVSVSYNHEYIFLGGIATYFGSSLGTKTLTATASMRSETAAAACP